VAEGGLGDLREHGRPVDRVDAELLDHQGHADEQHAEQAAQDDLRGLGAAHPGGAERRDRVGDRLDPGERRAAVGERPQEEQEADGLDRRRRGRR